MKIVTWNVNGLRSLKKDMSNILYDFAADVVCLQETKISRNLLQEEAALVEGYSSYFSFSKKQIGYSGVATYCREKCVPQKAEEGLSGILSAENKTTFVLSEELELGEFVQASDIYALDSEGRAIITYHKIRNEDKVKILAIINVYCPRVDPEKPERHVYKMQFCHLLAAKAKALCQNDYCVIVVGDLNIAHQMVDHCDPGNEKEFNSNEARQWLTSFLALSCEDSSTGNQFLDAYRYLHPHQREAYTCWNTLIGARETNYGTRIDYIIVNHILLPSLISCEILPDVHGSDHCPVVASFHLETIPCEKLPSICTRLYPEFAGKQQKLISFFQKSESSTIDNEMYMKVKQKFSSETIPLTKKRKIQSAGNNFKQDKQKSITNFFSSNLKAENNISIEDSAINSDFFVKECASTILSEIKLDIDQNVDDLELNTLEQEDDYRFKNIPDNQKNLWKGLLSGPPKPPLCKGHNKPCVLRIVKKAGPNCGRQFFACPQPNGHSSNPDSKCNFFQWVTPLKKSVLS